MFGVFRWINPEHDGNNLAPIGIFGGGIEQAQICDEMTLIVTVDALGLGRGVVEGGYRPVGRLAPRHSSGPTGCEEAHPLIPVRGGRCPALGITDGVERSFRNSTCPKIERCAKCVGTRRSNIAVEHDRRIDIECNRELFEHIDGRCVFGPFEHPDIVAIDPGTIGKLLLRQALGVPNLA
jgi:hypothetical protein